jgi:NAD(P)-dependent dehydrogenase (short-subunit alcohol dehydrogenase family)
VLLEGKVGIVSGVGPGIGRAAVLALAREGTDLALVARSEERLREVQAEVEALGRRALVLAADVTVPKDCERVAAETHAAFGRIDVLFNNAFTAHPVGRFADGPVETWRPAMEVNLWGSLNMTHAVVPYMLEAGEGRVIMSNATAARSSSPGYGPYIASKAALMAATRVLATELGPHGITVNTVAAGATNNPNFQAFCAREGERRGVDPQVVADEMAALNALRFLPVSEDVAQGVVFFASELGRAATAQFLLIDAGSQVQ